MIAIVSGTNRRESVSLKIAKQYAELLEALGQEVEIIDLQGIPKDFIFSALYENVGKNGQFNQFREVMNRADKLVFVIPEYNGSFPGVLKVFIDGLDRAKALTDKKSVLVGISAGDQGAGLALSHFTDILNYCGTHVLGYRLRIPKIGDKMTDNKIANPLYLEKVHTQAKKLVDF
jgi:NAD(P)H-dependent FMN reductase